MAANEPLEGLPDADNEEEFDIEFERDRLERRMLGAIAAGIIVAIAGVLLAIWVFFLWNRASDASAKADSTEDGLEAVSTGLDALRDQVEQLGERPVVPAAEDIVEDVNAGDPVLIPGQPGERGERGPEPTPEDIQAAVDLHCSRQPGGTCEGATGPEGAAGATGAQGVGVIGASIVDCHLIIVFSDGSSADSGNVCGPQGETGEPGPAPTDEQIQTAFNNFCATHNNCQGPPGPQGEPGPVCPEGYTQVDISIPSSPEFVFGVCAKPSE